jgi:hypothetical protein
MQIKTYVDQLIKGGWDKKEAEAKVKALQAAVIAQNPKENEAFQEKALKHAIGTILRSKIERLTGVCIGFGPKQDSNAFAKRKALEVYEQNPKEAIDGKFVAVNADGTLMMENNKPVPADNREFLDPDTKKMKNRNWGKKLEENIQREGMFIVNKQFVRVFGTYDCKIGYEYSIFGVPSDKGYITVPKNGPGIKVIRMLDDLDFWKLASEVAGKDDMAVDLASVNDIPKNKHVVTSGTVVTVRESGRGMMIVLNSDAFQEGLVCFTADGELNDEVNTLSPGNEIIAVGRTMETQDKVNGGVRRSLSFAGFASNPESAKLVGALKGLDAVMYE